MVNLCTSGITSQTYRAVEDGALEAMAELLKTDETDLILWVIQGIEHIFTCDISRTDEMVAMFDCFGGIRNLEYLQHHNNTVVYNKAVEIMEKYYYVEEELTMAN